MKKYEEVIIEVICLTCEDVITTSNPFDGKDDSIQGW